MDISAGQTTRSGVVYRLLPPTAPAGAVALTAEQRAVVENRNRRLRVLAGPGTGKTTTLVEAVAARLGAGVVKATELLVLTFSRRARDELAQRIAIRVGGTTRQPLVRTLHSYAYGLVRAQAWAAGEPAPRLLGAGEADQMIRELLAGHADGGGGPWPSALHPALRSPAFAAELGDLLARAAAQNIDPARLSGLGRRFKSPEWVAAAAFAREYQQVMDLRQGSSGFGTALDQAELTAAALAALTDDRIAAAEQGRIRRLFVDEYQDVDPAQAAMIERLAAGADELVVVGDPDQAIYAFRGAEPAALRRVQVDKTVSLTRSRRLPPAVVAATRRIAAMLPGPVDHRTLQTADGPTSDSGAVDVAVFGTAAAEAAAVAAECRRAHLVDGVPWRNMAVLVRSPAGAGPALGRAFAAAGVPLERDRPTGTPRSDPVVEAIVILLTCAVRPESLTPEVALQLLRSPLAGLDELELRTLRRALRAGAFGQGTTLDLIVALLAGGLGGDEIPEGLRARVGRLTALLELGRARAGDPSAHAVLWDIWSASGLAEELVAAVERGGRGADRAHRTLDSVLDLFRLAGDLAERLPMAGLVPFLAAVADQAIVVPATEHRAGHRDAVSLVSAHAAKGLEWDVVIVAGVQEGTWPDLRHHGRLLRADDLVDRAAGVPVPPSRVDALLAEERRLFYVAATRARQRLFCTAVSDQETVPSRFLAELLGTDDALEVRAAGDRRSRPLQLSALVADLRIAAADPAGGRRARVAARELARLARAGVPGAHPSQWHGLPDPSTDLPPVGAGETIRVSPSTVESLLGCPLRAALEASGGRRVEPTANQIEGIVVHALTAGLAAGVTREELVGQIHLMVDAQPAPPWQRDRARRVLVRMLDAAATWQASTHPPRELVGAELEVGTTLAAPEGGHPVRVAGRLDWLARQPDGSLVVSDFKTAASVPSRSHAQENAQLASYQLALARGGDAPGGGELIYLRSGRAKALPQAPLSPDEQESWANLVVTVAQGLAQPTTLARENPRCERCPVRGCCPIQPDGRQVTR